MARSQRTKYGMRTSLKVHLGEGHDRIVRDSIKVEQLERPLLRQFAAYAPPMTWGPDVTVASHIGSVTYTISYEAVGDTLVLGRVIYYKGDNGGQKVTEEFTDQTTITTADAVANVLCDFKGIPTGSAVNGTVTP